MLRSAPFREPLYADCSDEDVALCRLLLAPEPIAATSTPLQLAEQNFGRVPRTYIELLQDRAVSPALQKRTCPCSPFPIGLADTLEAGDERSEAA